MDAPTAPKFSSEAGASVLVAVLIVAVIAALLIASFMTSREQSLRLTRMAAAPAIRNSLAKSAIETFMLAWRFSEQDYYRQLTGCDRANSFVTALRFGSGCATATATVFGTSVAARDPWAGADTYSYVDGVTGCQIQSASSNCRDFVTPFITMDGGGQRLMGQSFKFNISDIFPGSRSAEITLTIEGAGLPASLMKFVIRDNFVNLIHSETDGRLVQERPDPLARCPSNAWAIYRIFLGGTCRVFDTLGSGTGLAVYRNRYFGFRPAEGIFIDMAAMADGGSPGTYIVEPDGTVGGVANVFAPYPPPDGPGGLEDADDVTLVDQQIYFVKGQGDVTRIGVVTGTPGAYALNTVCPIGAAGWGQSLIGVATQSSSEPLVPVTDDLLTGERHATFYSKTDGGNLLVTKVWSSVPGTYTCLTFKDAAMQETEYRRTLGFDRAVPEKLYFLY